MEAERRLREMGIELPDFGPATYYGASYGKMKPFHQTGSLLSCSFYPATSRRKMAR